MSRRSLRDRNRASIADQDIPDLNSPDPAETEEAPPEPAQDPPAANEAPTQPSAPQKAAQGRTAATTAASDIARRGIYLTPAEFDNAKAAYLADWNNGGAADTFARWIAAAIDVYAARTPQQRATAQPRNRAEERSGSTRSFAIPTATVTRMRAARTADHQAGRFPSDRAWCGEAIAYAVENARAKNAGTLPTPPPRLPNRLVR